MVFKRHFHQYFSFILVLPLLLHETGTILSSLRDMHLKLKLRKMVYWFITFSNQMDDIKGYILMILGGHRGRDYMVVGFTTCTISAYHHLPTCAFLYILLSLLTEITMR
jgi:hypothetical protein